MRARRRRDRDHGLDERVVRRARPHRLHGVEGGRHQPHGPDRDRLRQSDIRVNSVLPRLGRHRLQRSAVPARPDVGRRHRRGDRAQRTDARQGAPEEVAAAVAFPGFARRLVYHRADARRQTAACSAMLSAAAALFAGGRQAPAAPATQPGARRRRAAAGDVGGRRRSSRRRQAVAFEESPLGLVWTDFAGRRSPARRPRTRARYLLGAAAPRRNRAHRRGRGDRPRARSGHRRRGPMPNRWPSTPSPWCWPGCGGSPSEPGPVVGQAGGDNLFDQPVTVIGAGGVARAICLLAPFRVRVTVVRRRAESLPARGGRWGQHLHEACARPRGGARVGAHAGHARA